jgi:hypothetical protein
MKDEAEWMKNDELRSGWKKWKTVRCGNLTIVCQVNKLRLL